MDNFVGSLEKLKRLVQEAGYRGGWSVIAYGYRFQAEDGAVLSWFPEAANALYYQGPSEAKDRLRATLTNRRPPPVKGAEGSATRPAAP